MRTIWFSLSIIVIFSGYIWAADDCEEFTCTHPNGEFANPCNCRTFYICADFRPYKSHCPSGLFFDDVAKMCKFKHEAVCGPVKEDQIPKAEEVPEEERASKCNVEECQLPFCYCSPRGNEPIAPKEKIPQFIMISIDGAINSNNIKFYEALKDNGLKATFFIEHDYCDYFMVEQVASWGNEIALGTVTGDSLDRANVTTWRNELRSLKDIIIRYANINPEDIIGVRAPGLKVGRNEQFEVMTEEGFIWDSSIATTPLREPVWPYTMDYKIPHTCKFLTCPNKAFPGLWQIPVNSHYVEDGTGGQCSYLDQCIFTYQDSNDVFNWLKEDFLRNYEGNKAPYMIPLHTNWFLSEPQYQGLNKFINWTRESLDDVFYGTMTELLLWMTDPNVPESSPQQLLIEKSLSCNVPNSCKLEHEDEGIKTIRYMQTCSDCPRAYPWVKDHPDKKSDGSQ